MKYLLVCRSITYAKRMEGLLQAEGIKGRVVRTPLGAASESCGYSVAVGDDVIHKALAALREKRLLPKKIIRELADGKYAEVVL